MSEKFTPEQKPATSTAGTASTVLPAMEFAEAATMPAETACGGPASLKPAVAEQSGPTGEVLDIGRDEFRKLSELFAEVPIFDVNYRHVLRQAFSGLGMACGFSLALVTPEHFKGMERILAGKVKAFEVFDFQYANTKHENGTRLSGYFLTVEGKAALFVRVSKDFPYLQGGVTVLDAQAAYQLLDVIPVAQTSSAMNALKHRAVTLDWHVLFEDLYGIQILNQHVFRMPKLRFLVNPSDVFKRHQAYFFNRQGELFQVKEFQGWADKKAGWSAGDSGERVYEDHESLDGEGPHYSDTVALLKAQSVSGGLVTTGCRVDVRNVLFAAHTAVSSKDVFSFYAYALPTSYWKVVPTIQQTAQDKFKLTVRQHLKGHLFMVTRLLCFKTEIEAKTFAASYAGCQPGELTTTSPAFRGKDVGGGGFTAIWPASDIPEGPPTFTVYSMEMIDCRKR